MYFCTFTCYNWLHLFDITNAYELVYKWFDELKKNNHEVILRPCGVVSNPTIKKASPAVCSCADIAPG